MFVFVFVFVCVCVCVCVCGWVGVVCVLRVDMSKSLRECKSVVEL